MNRPLLIRADANADIGAGHVMRCLALAQAWQDTGGAVILAASDLPVSLSARLSNENIEVLCVDAMPGSAADAALTLGLARRLGTSWLAVDGYAFSPTYLESVGQGNARILAIDDYAHWESYPVDLLLNQNLSANDSLYSGRVTASTRMLLGPTYALLRREFINTMHSTRAKDGRGGRILITFGGSDQQDFTGAVLRKLMAEPPDNVSVVVLAGAANPHLVGLKALARAAAFPCEVRVNVDDVAAVMTWADAAISGGGSTVWELACMSLPSLIGAFEENQLAGMKALSAVPGLRAFPIEQLLTCDLKTEIESLLAAPVQALARFDAQGSLRVVGAMQALTVPLSLELLR